MGYDRAMDELQDKDPSLTLLGRSEKGLPEAPSAEILETFPNPRPGRDFVIHLETAEFSSLCPVTGQPDCAHLTIRYTPAETCVETKSLKFYLAAFRNQAGFNEEVVNRIADDLVAACAPKRLSVVGKFAQRGGIGLTVEITHPNESGE